MTKIRYDLIISEGQLAEADFSLYITNIIDNIIRDQLILYKQTSFNDIISQQWNYHKPFLQNKRRTYGIDFWRIELFNIIRQCKYYIGDFITDPYSRHIIEKIIYESILEFETLYSIIKPSRARVIQYKIDVLSIISIILYFIPLLESDESNHYLNKYHNVTKECIIDSINKMICRSVIYCNKSKDIIDYIQYCIDNNEKSIFNKNEPNIDYLYKLLNIQETSKDNFKLPDNISEDINIYCSLLEINDLINLEVDWKKILYLNPLSSNEVYELINGRHDLSEDVYPPLTDEEIDGSNQIKNLLVAFNILFIDKKDKPIIEENMNKENVINNNEEIDELINDEDDENSEKEEEEDAHPYNPLELSTQLISEEPLKTNNNETNQSETVNNNESNSPDTNNEKNNFN